MRIKFVTTVPPKYLMDEIKSQPYWLYFQVGEFYFNGGNIPKAIEMFERALDFNPEFAPGYHNLGVAYYSQQEYSKAEEFFLKAVEVDKKYGKGHYSLGVFYFERREFDNAIEFFENTIKINQKDANAHFDLGQSYVARFRQAEFEEKENYKDLSAALKHLKRAEKLEPGFPYAESNIEIIESIMDARTKLLKLK